MTVAARPSSGPPTRRSPERETPRAVTVGIPIAILIGLLALVILANPGNLLVRDDAPPVEDLTFDRTVLAPGEIRLHVTNQGPDPVVIAQVFVDEAYWEHRVEPDATVEPLKSAKVIVPYPWVEGEAHEVVLLTNTGATFGHEIEVALETPVPGGDTLVIYTLIGLFVGVLPIFAGLAWYPAIRRAGTRVELGILAFTIGLLAFLVVESLDEGLELAAEAPGPMGGPGLVLLAVAVAMATLIVVGHQVTRGQPRTSPRGRLVAAYLIAVGIGLHNLGEGLAIGAAYALGEVALGAFLILGFTLHNVTEGPAIVSPLGQARADGATGRGWTRMLKHLVFLGLIAGAPTILGAWIGGFAFSPFLGAVFFGLGAGAMAQVIWEVGRGIRAEPAAAHLQGTLAFGLVLGVAVMYATGLLI